MSLDKTPENQRSVRILAYNRMEITAENIERVKEADKQVTAVIEKLTPKNVLQMIRDGVNPLEKTFGELESYFAENPQSYEERKISRRMSGKLILVSIVWYTRLREKMVPQ